VNPVLFVTLLLTLKDGILPHNDRDTSWDMTGSEGRTGAQGVEGEVTKEKNE
jgi:hypothetical protein